MLGKGKLVKINELMFGIQKMDMVLPEFQREYVWTRDQAKKLIASLIHEYPTGSLLIWKTDNPPEIKNNAVAKDKIGTISVILDGQQRMTTLYLLIQNSIPPYYRPETSRTIRAISISIWRAPICNFIRLF